MVRVLLACVWCAIGAQVWSQPDARDLAQADSVEELVELVEQWRAGIDTWYIKSGQTGDGTSVDSFAGTWSDIAPHLGDGDRVYIHGDSVLREQIVVTHNGLRIAALPGTGRWTQTGRRLVKPADWSVFGVADGRTIYVANPPDEPVGFVYDYRLGTAEGLPELYVGHLHRSQADSGVAFAADLAQSQRPSWCWEPAGSIYVHFPQNDDPRYSAKHAEYLAPMTDFGFRISGVSQGEVSGGRIDCWWDNRENFWGFALTNTVGWTVRDMESADCFYHSFGATGSICRNNVFRDLVCRNIRRGTDSHIVQFCGNGNLLTGGLFEDVTIHLAGSRDHQGRPLETTGLLKGVAGHATGTIASPAGLVFRRITTVRYADEEANGGAVSVVHTGGNATPPDPADPATYPVIHEDCRYADFGAVNLSSSTSHAAFVRCAFVSDGSFTRGAAATSLINVASGSEAFFESCTFYGRMSDATNHVLIRVSGHAHLSNCSVYAAGPTDGIFFGGNSMHLQAVHSVFARESPGRFFKGGSMPVPEMQSNWYDLNIDDSGFAVPGAFNSQAEWESTVDPGGVYDVDFASEFQSLVTLQPTLYGRVWNELDQTANPRSPEGINLAPYDGNAGAWQRTD